MTLTTEKCDDFVRHTLGGPMGAPLSALALVNHCGEWFCSTHPWQFNRDRAKRLDARQAVSFTGATYTHSNFSIVLAAAFDFYQFEQGDRLVEVTGTGVNPREVEVASRQSGGEIRLVSSGLGTTADASADIAGTIPANTIALPSDLRHIDAIDTIDGGSSEGFTWLSQPNFTYNRTGRWSFSTSSVKGTIVNIQPSAGGAIKAYIEIDPNFESAPTGFAVGERLYLRYTRGWRKLTDSTAVLPLPDDDSLDMLFLQALVTMARGWDREDEGSMAQRLDAFKASDLWRSYTSMDGTKQPNLGPLSGSDIRRRSRTSRRYQDIRKET